MNHAGIVKNGVIILDDGHSLPEGTRVSVFLEQPAPETCARRKEFPLIHSERPGSVHLTNQMIGAILDEEDAAGIALAKPQNQPDPSDTAPNIPNPK